VTKLGRLVKAGKISNMEEIYLHSLPIKEFQIVDYFLPKLKDEVMKVRFRSHGRKSAFQAAVFGFLVGSHVERAVMW
jgi:ribosomal protein S5